MWVTRIAHRFSNFSQVNSAFTLLYSTSSSRLKPMSTSTFGSLNPAKVSSNISSLQLKKRTVRKKKIVDDETKKVGLFDVVGYATAEEYNLEKLHDGLKEQDLYDPAFIENSPDVLVATAKYQIEKEPREIFFFREGSVILWNTTDSESGNLLKFIKPYETDSYSDKLVEMEREIMTYRHLDPDKPSKIEKNGEFLLNTNPENILLDKYTFSNALVLSVKLSVWEALLEKYIDSIEYVTEDLKKGNKIKMSREEVLRKHGELFALRHLINLSSDLLDTPDFYWENEQLENLYIQNCTYFCINKRTRVMNEKINHCVELIELLATHLSDKHHTRLEWMIIILILVEVCFEIVHYGERYLLNDNEKHFPSILSSAGF